MQRVAHRELHGDFGLLALSAAEEEDAAVADVRDAPTAVVGEEGEGEVGGGGKGAGGGRGGVRRESVVDPVVVEKGEEGRVLEAAEAAEEGFVGDDPAEGDAGGGGAGKVFRSGQPEEDLRDEVVGDLPRPLRRRAVEVAIGVEDWTTGAGGISVRVVAFFTRLLRRSAVEVSIGVEGRATGAGRRRRRAGSRRRS